EHMNNDRSVVFGGVAYGFFETFDVVTVERAAVANTERFEEDRRFEHLTQPGTSTGESPGEMLADDGNLANDLFGLLALPDVAGIEAQAGEAFGEASDRRGVRAAVVVQDDDGAASSVAEVVECLVGHAAGERAIADDGDRFAAATRIFPPVRGELSAQVFAHGQTVGVGEHGRSVAVFDPVVFRFGPARIAGEAIVLADGVELIVSAGEEFVDVGEMA